MCKHDLQDCDFIINIELKYFLKILWLNKYILFVT
jgi:hypothetical protein